jgi:hypothetical protein
LGLIGLEMSLNPIVDAITEKELSPGNAQRAWELLQKI